MRTGTGRTGGSGTRRSVGKTFGGRCFDATCSLASGKGAVVSRPTRRNWSLTIGGHIAEMRSCSGMNATFRRCASRATTAGSNGRSGAVADDPYRFTGDRKPGESWTARHQRMVDALPDDGGVIIVITNEIGRYLKRGIRVCRGFRVSKRWRTIAVRSMADCPKLEGVRVRSSSIGRSSLTPKPMRRRGSVRSSSKSRRWTPDRSGTGGG